MSKRIHGMDPADPSRCLCGHIYPQGCRGGIPILREGYQPIRDLALKGVSFTQIAEQTGHSIGIVRRIVHDLGGES